MLVDTHCHIHSKDYPLDPEQAIANALENGVEKFVCVGTDVDDSAVAIKFVQNYDNCWASVGVHPHDAKDQINRLNELEELVKRPKVVAIGECGLDYFYDKSPRDLQEKVLCFQIELAVKHGLPLIFHIRDAFDDFWRIIGDYPKATGVIHSFTDTLTNAKQAAKHNFFIGVNGIATFTKNEIQQAMFKNLSISQIVLETDSPFLTPVPYRGTVNEPKNVQVIAQFLAKQQNKHLDCVANATTKNAQKLFKI